jgi:hypothetical protein
VSSKGSPYSPWLTRKALLEAKEDENEWPGIFVSTTGLVFFGTPFRGAEGMGQSEMLAAAWREYDPDQVQPEVLKILEPGNEFLQDLVDQFGKTRKAPHKAHVACFYKLKSSNVGAIVGKQERTVCILAEVHPRDAKLASDLLQRFVVSESSGCLDLSDSTEKYSLSRTHFNMNYNVNPLPSLSGNISNIFKSIYLMRYLSRS